MNKGLVKFGVGLVFAGVLSGATADVSQSSFTTQTFNNTSFTDVITIGLEEVISDLSVTVNLYNRAVGDLTMTLSNGSGTVTLIPESLIDNSNLGNLTILPLTLNTAPYTFSDNSTSTIADAAALVGNGTQIDPNTTYLAASGSPTFGGAFAGSSTAGDWTLSITDATGGLTNTRISGWSVNITSAVPEPAPLALLAAGGLLLYARKRRIKISG